MTKKKKLIVILSACLALLLIAAGVFIALANNNNKMFGIIAEVTNNVNITANISSTKFDIQGSTTLNTTWTDITNSKSGTFSQLDVATAKFSFLMCLDSENTVHVNLEDGTNTSDVDNESFPKSLGFDYVDEFYIGEDATENTNDTARMVISRGEYNVGCGEKDYFINISLANSGDKIANEWKSNFDIGSTNTALYKTSTTDWTDKTNHKGFDVTATRALKMIMDYLKAIPNADESIYIIVINGYSRGGAIANIVATRFADEFKKTLPNAFLNYSCYTFATPGTTTRTATDKLSSEAFIFNFVGQEDVITNVPPTSIGFRRYGTDVSFTLTGDGNESLRDAYRDISKKTYNASYIKEVVTELSKICKNPEDHYNPDPSDPTLNKLYSYSSETEANNMREYYAAFYSVICPTNSEMYFKLSEVQKVGNEYQFTFTCAPSYIGQLLPNALDASVAKANNISLFSYINEIGTIERYNPLVKSLVSLSLNNGEAIQNMHFPYQYLTYLNTLQN